MAFGDTSGSQTLTADGALGRSGDPARVFLLTFISGASAGNVQLFNGTAVSGNPVISVDGTANRSKLELYGDEGLLFPSGCFVDVNGASAATIEYRLEA